MKHVPFTFYNKLLSMTADDSHTTAHLEQGSEHAVGVVVRLPNTVPPRDVWVILVVCRGQCSVWGSVVTEFVMWQQKVCPGRPKQHLTGNSAAGTLAHPLTVVCPQTDTAC
jgi:hypothetical protein